MFFVLRLIQGQGEGVPIGCSTNACACPFRCWMTDSTVKCPPGKVYIPALATTANKENELVKKRDRQYLQNISDRERNVANNVASSNHSLHSVIWRDHIVAKETELSKNCCYNANGIVIQSESNDVWMNNTQRWLCYLLQKTAYTGVPLEFHYVRLLRSFCPMTPKINCLNHWYCVLCYELIRGTSTAVLL